MFDFAEELINTPLLLVAIDDVEEATAPDLMKWFNSHLSTVSGVERVETLKQIAELFASDIVNIPTRLPVPLSSKIGIQYVGSSHAQAMSVGYQGNNPIVETTAKTMSIQLMVSSNITVLSVIAETLLKLFDKPFELSKYPRFSFFSVDITFLNAFLVGVSKTHTADSSVDYLTLTFERAPDVIKEIISEVLPTETTPDVKLGADGKPLPSVPLDKVDSVNPDDLVMPDNITNPPKVPDATTRTNEAIWLNCSLESMGTNHIWYPLMNMNQYSYLMVPDFVHPAVVARKEIRVMKLHSYDKAITLRQRASVEYEGKYLSLDPTAGIPLFNGSYAMCIRNDILWFGSARVE